MTLGKQGARGRQIYPWAIESEKQAGTQHRMGERPLLGSEVAAELGGQGSSAGRSTWDPQGHCDLPALPLPRIHCLGLVEERGSEYAVCGSPGASFASEAAEQCGPFLESGYLKCHHAPEFV